MMNIFYYDRITLGLDAIESALAKLNHGEAKEAADALAEIRDLVDDTRSLSRHAENIWNKCAVDIGQVGDMGRGPINPRTGETYTYVDQWAARYELVRREIERRLDSGHTIVLMPPPASTLPE